LWDPINPANAYPLADGGVRDLPSIPLADAVELLILLTAHEVAHIERWERFARQWKRLGRRDALSERDTEMLARGVLAAFRADRGRLLAAWGESGPGPVPPEYVYRLDCPSCGSSWTYARPRRGACCVRCHGEQIAACRLGAAARPPSLECRRVPRPVNS
jgi:hypothetical protein